MQICLYICVRACHSHGYYHICVNFMCPVSDRIRLADRQMQMRDRQNGVQPANCCCDTNYDLPLTLCPLLLYVCMYVCNLSDTHTHTHCGYTHPTLFAHLLRLSDWQLPLLPIFGSTLLSFTCLLSQPLSFSSIFLFRLRSTSNLPLSTNLPFLLRLLSDWI